MPKFLAIFLRRLTGATACACMALAILPPALLRAQNDIPPREQAAIDKDISRHFGSAPADPGPRAKNLSAALKPRAVRKAVRKVADWQLRQSQPYFDRIWTWSVMYSGFMAAADALPEPRYRKAMDDMANGFHWQLRSQVPNADDQSIGQTYLELYLRNSKANEMEPTKEALDRLLAGAAAKVPANQAQIPWWWCDALFMAPPVWSRMYASTQDAKYLDYVDQHWSETSKLLYDPEQHLFYRDVTFLQAKEPNGEPVFWSRGEGWVMAGIARTLDHMPADWKTCARYEQQLREMAEAVKKLQDPQSGLWHASMMDAADYPQPETSGSALMTFALAWGINHGVLSRAEYEPVVAKAWRGLLGEVYADGRLGNIQQTGSAPAHYLPSSSYTYGVGGFLLAGSEVLELSEHAHHSHLPRSGSMPQ